MNIFMIDWNGSVMRSAFSCDEKAQKAIEKMGLPQDQVQIFQVQVDA